MTATKLLPDFVTTNMCAKFLLLPLVLLLCVPSTVLSQSLEEASIVEDSHWGSWSSSWTSYTSISSSGGELTPPPQNDSSPDSRTWIHDWLQLSMWESSWWTEFSYFDTDPTPDTQTPDTPFLPTSPSPSSSSPSSHQYSENNTGTGAFHVFVVHYH